jgi:hypothetical protein
VLILRVLGICRVTAQTAGGGRPKHDYARSALE